MKADLRDQTFKNQPGAIFVKGPFGEPYMDQFQENKMDTYKKLVIVELQQLGKTYEWAEMAVNKIDLAHYWKKYFATELAELIIANQKHLDYLT